MRSILVLCLVASFALLFGCAGTPDLPTTTTSSTATTTSSVTTTTISASLVAPSDLTYVGAFRLPAYPANPNNGWEWGGQAMAYCASGDPSGASDGYPGSLFGMGHTQLYYVGEIDIPAPVNSSGRNLTDLNTATLLNGFTNVRSGISALETLFANSDIVRSGLAYLPAMGSQTTPKLYASFGAHFQEDLQNQPSHLWFESDLTANQGSWNVLNSDFITRYSVNDYMFEIPEDFANTYLSGRRLATGRYRDGGWSGMGPCLFAIAPWAEGNPPSAGAVLPATRLIQYASTSDIGYRYGETDKMTNYLHSDEWTGAAWLSTSSKSAVIFVGTKGTGTTEAWYGNAYGPTMETEDRGWWSTSFEGWVVFYSPVDLAAVAQGSMQPYEIQPYATLNIDQYLYNIESADKEGIAPNQKKYHLGACAYDATRQLLYIFEYLGDADNNRPLVHVFSVS